MPLTEKEIKEIIEEGIIVDCYDDEEVHTGWEIYMGENINFPFKAECLIRKASGATEWKKVKIIDSHTYTSKYGGKGYYLSALLDEVDMIIPVEISELRNVKADEDTLNTFQIWGYRHKY